MIVLKKIKLIRLFACIIICFYCTSCTLSELKSAETSNSISAIQDIEEIESFVNGKIDFKGQIQLIHLKEIKDLTHLYFLNESTGYSVTKFGQIYKTVDKGNNWNRLSYVKNLSVEGIFFINEAKGFIIANKLSTANKFEDNISSILKTEDGGRSWKTIYSSNATFIIKMIFDPSGRGWVIGMKYSLNPEIQQNNLVILTNNEGQTWIDVSDNLNQIATNSNHRVDDYLTDINYSNDKVVTVLSLRGRLYNTDNGGMLWNSIANLLNEPAQTCICQLGRLENGDFWLAGGTISTEGSWSMVAINRKDRKWEKYRLNGYFFSDITFISNKDIIAAGSIVSVNNFGGANELNKGVILYSTDRGKSWTIVHESQLANEFISIDKLSEHQFFIAGKNDVGILLEN